MLLQLELHPRHDENDRNLARRERVVFDPLKSAVLCEDDAPRICAKTDHSFPNLPNASRDVQLPYATSLETAISNRLESFLQFDTLKVLAAIEYIASQPLQCRWKNDFF